MKIVHRLLGAALAVFLILAVFILSFYAAVYGDKKFRFYKKEYEKYRVKEELSMDMPHIMEVTRYMMEYLIGRRRELSVYTKVEGKEQDFFNERDRLHMEDVRGLFLKGLWLGRLFLGASILAVLLLKMTRANMGELLTRSWFAALGATGIIIILLGLLFAFDFTKYFTVFHEIFFSNDLWLFDPAEDFMIRMLPEGFFFDMSMRIGGIFAVNLAALSAAAGAWRMRIKKNQKKEAAEG